MLKKTLFFVHIPKTGGTSLRKAIEEKVGEDNSFYDYGPHSEVTSHLILEQRYKKKNIRDIEKYLEDSSKKWSLICGHTRASIYSSIINPCNIITFMRNPIDRVVSNYEHLKRHGNYRGSLTEFCVKPHFRNTQSKSLQGYPVELLGFIGITDYFEKSIELFKKQYDLSIKELKLNTNEQKKINSNYNLDVETLNMIINHNQEDIELYNNAKDIFESKYALRDEGSHNIYGNVDLLNNSSVNGWCFINNPQKKDIVEIEILKNKEIIGKVRPQIIRPSLKKLNTPNEGAIGFNFKFSQRPQTNDHIECKVSGTNYILPGVKRI